MKFPFDRAQWLIAASLSLLLLVAPWQTAAAEEGERPVVAVAKVERGEMSEEATFQAEFRPYQEVALHAWVTGYLKTISVDEGDIVKEGQVLATLNVPELETEMDHALATERRGKAETARAQAAYDDAHLSFDRITSADKARPNLIAQQDIDAARAKELTTAAALDAAKQQEQVDAADVKKLKVMEGYTKITTPFSGVITERYSDPGALIQAGTSSGSMPLVRLSQNDRLRAVFPVSVSYVAAIKAGQPVELTMNSPKATINGKIARFSRKVDTATRTMDVEVDVPNPNLTLTPGVYATAILKTASHPDALSVPIEAVARTASDTASVYVINSDHVIENRPVKIGIESSSRVEILSGLKAGELVLLGSRAQVKPGQAVETKIIESTPAAATDEAKAASPEGSK